MWKIVHWNWVERPGINRVPYLFSQGRHGSRLLPKLHPPPPKLSSSEPSSLRSTPTGVCRCRRRGRVSSVRLENSLCFRVLDRSGRRETPDLSKQMP